MSWEIIMGLEVHAELSTRTKIFCECKTEFGSEPNTQVCPICAGMPGTLPALNQSVVEYAVKLGLALNCDITPNSCFDRKNYFYPDLPKAYQISQLYAPICQNGYLEIKAEGQSKTINIKQIHMEEDAGKLTHDSTQTYMDFNRCGVPLLEIVTQPDFRSAKEVIAYLEQLREIMLYLDICDCKMQEGSMRADVNLSVRKPGDELGVRTEMKNLNSFKAIGRAIEYESARQIKLLERGASVVQETRRWDDDKGESYSMRSKENAQDYRYFPEPDLPLINVDSEWIAQIKSNLPELAAQKRARYMSDFELSEYDATVLTVHKNISDLFEDISKKSGEPLESARLVMIEIMRLIKNTNTLTDDLSCDGSKYAVLVSLVTDGKINRNAYKETIEAVFSDDVCPDSYIAEKGLLIVSDTKAIEAAVKSALEDNPGAVADYHLGKEKALDSLMGQAMKRLGGKATPSLVKEVLINEVGKMK